MALVNPFFYILAQITLDRMYRSGANHERQLLNRLKSAGYIGIRAAKSTCPDLLVGKAGRVLAIECKYTAKDALYLPKSEVLFLNGFADAFGCEAILALKFGRKDWFFLPARQLNANGNGYCIIRKENAPRQGISII